MARIGYSPFEEEELAPNYSGPAAVEVPRKPLAPPAADAAADPYEIIKAKLLAERGKQGPSDEDTAALEQARQRANQENPWAQGLASVSEAADMITGVKSDGRGARAAMEAEKARQERAASDYERVKAAILEKQRQKENAERGATEEARFRIGLTREDAEKARLSAEKEKDRQNALEKEDRDYKRQLDTAKFNRESIEGVGDKDRASRERIAALERAAHLEAARIAAERARKGDGGAQLPASEAAQLAELEAAGGFIDDLEKDRQKLTGPMSGINQYIGGTDASKYTDAQRAAAQKIGTILEGGKLTDADLQKYMDLMPTAGDGADRAKAKVDRLKKMIAVTREAKLNGMRSAGFNMSGFGNGRATPVSGNLDLTAPSAPSGKVKVSNGKESLFIDPADLAAAQADGYRKVD